MLSYLGPPRRSGSTRYKVTDEAFLYGGIYKDSKGKKEEGVFFGRFDFATNTFSKLQEIPFDGEMLSKISKQKSGKIKGQINIKNLLLKSNKDVILLFELNNSKSGMRTIPDNNQRNESQWVTDNNNLDILYYNFNSQNELTYSGNIEKHQKKDVAADSFLAASIENTTYILFNSLDGDAKIMKYDISKDGTVTENVVNSSGKKYISPGNQNSNIFINLGKQGLSHLITNNDEILLEGRDGKHPTLVKIKL